MLPENNGVNTTPELNSCGSWPPLGTLFLPSLEQAGLGAMTWRGYVIEGELGNYR